jgi:Ni,Fe-hydrogenase I large subunit
MTLNIENYLYSLDHTLSLKSERDKMMLYGMIFAGLFAFSYLLFWESSEADFKTSHEKAIAMESDLNNDKQYLEANPPERIIQIEQETKAIELEYQHYIQYNTYIKDRLEQISSLYYDEVIWGAYLDSISKYARSYNVKLTQFGNALTTDNSSFGHVLDISISSDAPFKNTLKFINALEQSTLVVDLHDMNMVSDTKLKSDLNISVWGIVRQ